MGIKQSSEIVMEIITGANHFAEIVAGVKLPSERTARVKRPSKNSTALFFETTWREYL